MKKDNKKNKKPLYALLLVAIIGIIGGTIAYFSNTQVFPNVFGPTPKIETTESVEEFVSPNPWDPGTTTDKKVVTINKASFPVAVRAKFEEEWVPANYLDTDDTTKCYTDDTKTTEKKTLDLTYYNGTETVNAAQINWSNMDYDSSTDTWTNSATTTTGVQKWYKHSDGWYYYEAALAAAAAEGQEGGRTVTPLESVTLRADVPAGEGTTEVCSFSTDGGANYTEFKCGTMDGAHKDAYDAGGANYKEKKVVTTGSTGCGYDGAQYTLTITVETIEYSEYKNYWTGAPTIGPAA